MPRHGASEMVAGDSNPGSACELRVSLPGDELDGTEITPV